MDSFSALIICTVLLTKAAECYQLQSMVSMEGVKATLTFDTSGADVVATVEAGSVGLVGTVSLEVRSVLMEYDVEMKCSDYQLGAAVAGMTSQTVNLPSTPTATWTGTTLKAFEGKSILLTQNGKMYCAAIERPGDHVTAVAKFMQNAFGLVYFRQSMESNSPTIIFSSIYSAKQIGQVSWLVSSADCNKTPSAGGRVGTIEIGANAPGLRASMLSNAITLMGTQNIIGKNLVIKGSSGTIACAPITKFYGRTAVATFSKDGATGTFTFTQKSPLDVSVTDIELNGLASKAKGYHVHLWPMPIQVSRHQALCAPDVVSGHLNPYAIQLPYNHTGYATTTDDLFEVGDLSSKYGSLADLTSFGPKNFTDWNLPLYGKNSIVGRSVVIHRNDAGNSRWICTNIVLQKNLVTAVATFKYPIIGQIVFTQVKDMPQSGTSVFVNLEYIDGRAATSNQMWHLTSNPVGTSMLSTNMTTRCTSTGAVFNPLNIGVNNAAEASYCSPSSTLSCMLGDLCGKNGNISVGTKGAYKKAFYTDINIPLSGANSVIGKSVVINDEAGSEIVACADVMAMHSPKLVSKIDMNGIKGHVSFQQQPSFGEMPVQVMVQLNGVSANSMTVNVHELPPINNDCTTVGPIYNPLAVTSPAQAVSDDQFPVGDLRRRGSSMDWKDLNLPLHDETSIRGRSVVVTDTSNNMKACASIAAMLPSHQDKKAISQAVFSGSVTGTATLHQILYSDGSTSDTTITLNLSNSGGASTLNHNWHVHVNPIGNDATATTGTCMSAGPHYDPFMANIDGAKTLYSTECKRTDPLRCELGDQARKLGTYNIGGGIKVFTDVDLPLDGDYSVQGRSLVIHVANKGPARQACADLIPVGGFPLAITLPVTLSADRRAIAAKYATVIGTASQNVVLQLISKNTSEMKLYLHFIGLHRDLLRAQFKAQMKKANVRTNLGQYNPTSIADVKGNHADAGAKVHLIFIILAFILRHLLVD